MGKEGGEGGGEQGVARGFLAYRPHMVFYEYTALDTNVILGKIRDHMVDSVHGPVVVQIAGGAQEDTLPVTVPQEGGDVPWSRSIVVVEVLQGVDPATLTGDPRRNRTPRWGLATGPCPNVQAHSCPRLVGTTAKRRCKVWRGEVRGVPYPSKSKELGLIHG